MSDLSLNWLVKQYPTYFYNPEWFKGEPFAQKVVKPLQPDYYAAIEGLPHLRFDAGVFAYWFITAWRDRGVLMWPDEYVKTGDVDREGHLVYVGRSAQYGGLQIHRLLTPELL